MSSRPTTPTPPHKPADDTSPQGAAQPTPYDTSKEASKDVSYASYLKVPELLSLQQTLTDAHDELQFIVVHQAFELWFKLALFELESLRAALLAGEAVQGQHYLRRVRAIMRMLTGSFEVIETMRPYDFLRFRERLQPASGLQSLQWREIEFLCGAKDPRYLALASGAAKARLEARLAEPTLWDAYVSLLGRHGLTDSQESTVLALVTGIMRNPDQHPLGPLTEQLVELDQQFSIWRARHMQMTMRMIGKRPGTGQKSVQALSQAGYEQMGSGGVDYLRSTLDRQFFPILWEARTFIGR